MHRRCLTFAFVLLMAGACLAQAQTTSAQQLDEQLRVLSSFEHSTLLERDRLRQSLNDPDVAVFYYPASDRWITMPRDEAVDLADRLIVAAELNPALMHRLRDRLGLAWIAVEVALSEPGLVAEQLVARVEARQRPQLEAVLEDYDALLGELRTLFAETRAQRDALSREPDGIPNLEGTWGILGTDEVVRIAQTGTSIEAVKTVGNDNVPAGKVTFWADLSTLEGEGQQASRGFTNPRIVEIKMNIIDDDSFEVVWQGGRFRGTYVRQSR